MTTDQTLRPHEFIQINRYHMASEGSEYVVEHYFFHYLSDEAHKESNLKPNHQTVVFSDAFGKVCSLSTERNSKRLPVTLHTFDGREDAPAVPAGTVRALLQSGIDLMVEKNDWLRYPSVYISGDVQPDIRAVMVEMNTENRDARVIYLAEQEKEKIAKAAEMVENQKALEKQQAKDAVKNAKKSWNERQQRDAQKKSGINLS